MPPIYTGINNFTVEEVTINVTADKTQATIGETVTLTGTTNPPTPGNWDFQLHDANDPTNWIQKHTNQPTQTYEHTLATPGTFPIRARFYPHGQMPPINAGTNDITVEPITVELASTNHQRLGETVTFTGTTNPPTPGNWDFELNDTNNASNWIQKHTSQPTQTYEHALTKIGSYPVRVRFYPHGQMPPIYGTTRHIHIIEDVHLNISADKTQATIGETVTVTATTNPPTPGNWDFELNDTNNAYNWIQKHTSQPTQTYEHTLTTPGTFPIRVRFYPNGKMPPIYTGINNFTVT